MSQLMVLSMLLFFGLTVPVAVSIGLASMVAVGADGHMTWLVIAQQLYAAMDKYPLVAVPFFILAGNLMEAGGISERMVEFAKSVVGGVQGGLACSCVLTCMIFAAVAGSSVATTFAVGSILIPAMVKHGYPPPFAAFAGERVPTLAGPGVPEHPHELPRRLQHHRLGRLPHVRRP